MNAIIIQIKRIKETASLNLKRTIVVTLLAAFSLGGMPLFAHCDSYDGPVIKDAVKALESNNVSLILKWIDKEQESEVVSLFNKTYNLSTGDKQVYEIVKKHFYKTLVRLHRETEGASFTGLKPSGTTKQIILMSDKAIETEEVDNLVRLLNDHLNKAIHEKYHKVAALSKVKDSSPEQGREYVKAYIDYTHTLEAVHDIIEHSETPSSGHAH